MNSLNTSLVDAGKVEAISPGVGSGASVEASELQDEELSKLASLGVALLYLLSPFRIVRGLAWPLRVIEARLSSLR